MNAILVSIPPEVCERIVNGEQTVLLVKRLPNLDAPYKVYMYETRKKQPNSLKWGMGEWIPVFGKRGSGKVIGSFVCDKQEKFTVGGLRSDDIEKLACVSFGEMISLYYKPEELDGKTTKTGCALHITDLTIFDIPEWLGNFYRPCEKYKFDDYPWCWDCNHFIYGGYNEPELSECGVRGRIQLTRPPATFCYVEELSE